MEKVGRKVGRKMFNPVSTTVPTLNGDNITTIAVVVIVVVVSIGLFEWFMRNIYGDE